jgi:ligand-binding sensor domain-containing protein
MIIAGRVRIGMRGAALCLLVICSLSLQRTVAQGLTTPEVVHLDIKGLPAASIRCLAKDHDGVLWIGTENGLCRYDGLNVDVYRNIPGDSLSLQGNYILDLLLDGEGKIWVACFGGVSMFDPHEMKFARKVLCANNRRFPGYESVDLFLDDDGQIWSACVANGVARYDAATGSFHEVEAIRSALPPGESYPNTLGVLRDAQGIVWIPDRLSMFRYDPKDGSVQRFAFNAVGHDRRERIHLDHVRQDVTDPNILWLGSWGLGLVRFDKRTREFTNTMLTKGGQAELTNIIWSIQPEADGRLLVGYENGLRWFDPRTSSFSGTLQQYEWKTGSFNSLAYALLKDEAGRTWIGTIDGLLTLPPHTLDLRTLRLRGQSWCPAVDRPGYWAVREYAQRTLFKIGPEGQLLDSLPLPNADAERYEPISILQQHDGHVLIGTTQGLIIYDPSAGSFEREPLKGVPQFHGLSPNVSSIVEQADGTLWLACNMSGVLHSGPTDRNFLFHAVKNARDTSARNECNALESLDKDHIAMIFGWEGVGVLDTRTMQVTELTTHDTAGADLQQVESLVVYGNGILHAVTHSNGVVALKYNGKSITRLGTWRDEQDQGNSYNDATGDASGNTWIATNAGLVKFDVTDGSFKHFDPVDGFPLSSIAAIQADKDDRMIAWNAEFVRFDPRSLDRTSDLSGLYIRTVTVNGVANRSGAIDTARALMRLKYDQSAVAIGYAPIALLHAEALHYEVMLEGHDPHWVDNGSNRTVSYVGLPPGHYTFRARIAGKKDDRSRTSFSFIIVPAWWQTWWFRILAAMLSGGTVFFLSRYVLQLRYHGRIAALEREREVSAIRTRIARDIHDDIGSGLTRITMLSREMNAEGGASREKERLAGSIARASTELIGQLGEIVWTVDPGNERAERFIAHVRDLLGRQFEELGVKLRTDLSVEAGMELRDIPPDVKRNVAMLLKEAVSNALKHAQARTVSVKLRIGAGELWLHVEDDGAGFDTSIERSRGNGLGNLRRRSEAMGGTLEVQSDATGTRYALRVPLPSPTFMRDR